MKRLLFSGLLLLGFGTAALAQNDDIYYSPTEAQKRANEEQSKYDRAPRRQDDQQNYSSSNGQYSDNQNDGYYDDANAYNSDDYIDYDNDYYYSTRINRFSNPFYNLNYWSGYYNPYWYDPHWVDPYWGYNPWYRPGFSVSFGPSWSSYWGYNSWYGYSSFGSCYNYPYWGGGWGGYGGGCYGYNSGYYNNYWNGYYAGYYNNYSGGGYGNGWRAASYGPRFSLNSANNSHIRPSLGGRDGFRSNAGVTAHVVNGPRPNGFRGNTTGTGNNTFNENPRGGVRGEQQTTRPNSWNNGNNEHSVRGGERPGYGTEERPGRGSFGQDNRPMENNGVRGEDRRPTYNEEPRSNGNHWNSEQPSAQPERGNGWNASPRPEYNNQPRSYESPRQAQPMPRSEPARSYSQPRTESAPAPRVSSPSPAPSRSGGGGGSFGGGRSSGGGGGGFGGGGSRGGGRR